MIITQSNQENSKRRASSRATAGQGAFEEELDPGAAGAGEVLDVHEVQEVVPELILAKAIGRSGGLWKWPAS
jgi:hypothetical protein